MHYATAEEVFAFYDGWKFFTTIKQFAYADVYNPAEAPNRRVKRIIEAENKKERQKERVKFNEVVRELIEKLMDKDPRYKKFLLI
jgi:DnaJ homolog subfamily A member 5